MRYPKVPAGREEMEKLRRSLREEISEEDLEMVTGGNDDIKDKLKNPIPWNCPFCGATIMIRQFEDGPKHITKCPNNPYK